MLFHLRQDRAACARLAPGWLLLAGVASGLLAGCGGGGSSAPAPTPPSNVLVVVLDDWGADMFARSGVHPDAPPTPTLDALADAGVYFTRFYAAPTCSPTRSQILTGRHNFRTQLGEPINHWQNEAALALDEVTIAEVLDNAAPTPVASAAIGKWHLGSLSVGDLDHATLQGFDWFAGTLGNLVFGDTFAQYTKTVNGAVQASSTYVTTDQVDDALARITASPEPWCVYLGFNAPHQPFHAPPSALHTQALAGNPNLTPNAHYKAALEAVDTELGRLLAALPPDVRARTTVIVLGDNGTPNEAITAPSVNNQNKGTLFEGGVNVPLIIAGPTVVQPGRTSDALVHAVDVFPTVADLLRTDVRAGVGDNRPIDGRSLAALLASPSAPPVRTTIFHQRFAPNGPPPYASEAWMVRDARWKLIRRVGQADQLYDLQGVVREGASLDVGALTPEQQAAYDALVLELAAVLGS